MQEIPGGAAGSSVGVSCSSSGVLGVTPPPPAKRQRVDADTGYDFPGHGLAAEADTASATFCTWKGTYRDLHAKHLPTECQFHPIPCGHQYGCNATWLPDSVSPHGCPTLVKRSDMPLHQAKRCAWAPWLVDTCTICSHRVPVAAMEAHRKEYGAVHTNILEKRNDELKKLLGASGISQPWIGDRKPPETPENDLIKPFHVKWKLDACPQDGRSTRSDRFVPRAGVEFEISAHRHSSDFLTLRIVLAKAPPSFVWTEGALVWNLSARHKDSGKKSISERATTVWKKNEIVAGPAPAATFRVGVEEHTRWKIKLDVVEIHTVKMKTYKVNTVVEVPAE